MFKTTVRPIADTDTNTDFVCFVVTYPGEKRNPYYKKVIQPFIH